MTLRCHGPRLVPAFLTLTIGLALGGAHLGRAQEAFVPEPQRISGKEVLRRAFKNLYDCDLRMILTVALQNTLGEESIRRAEIARKRIAGRLHSYGRFLDPPWMRGTAFLILDNEDRSDDHFLFLPQENRVRRITSVQRTDAFLGSDLSHEDLERRHPSDYEIRSLRTDRQYGEPVYVVDTTPVHSADYSRTRFVIATADFFTLKIASYRENSDRPFKVIEAPREFLSLQGGHRMPTLLRVQNRLRGTRTEARFEQLTIDPELSDGLFTSIALETRRKIPGLIYPE